MLNKVNDQLTECLTAKDVCVERRLEKHTTVLQLISVVRTFEEDEKRDSSVIQIKRENYLIMVTELRNLSEKIGVLKMETDYLNAVSDGDKKLNLERNALLLSNL